MELLSPAKQRFLFFRLTSTRTEIQCVSLLFAPAVDATPVSNTASNVSFAPVTRASRCVVLLRCAGSVPVQASLLRWVTFTIGQPSWAGGLPFTSVRILLRTPIAGPGFPLNNTREQHRVQQPDHRQVGHSFRPSGRPLLDAEDKRELVRHITK